jgi:arylsulfatase A-like enzyme
MNSRRFSVPEVDRWIPYLSAALFAIASIGTKALFIIHVARGSGELLGSWTKLDYVFVFLVDMSAYVGLRILIDFIIRLNLSQKHWSFVAKTLRAAVLIATWYTVASAHYYMIMGDHLTLAFFVAADVGKMDYLSGGNIMLLLTEFALVAASFVYVLPRAKPLPQFLDRALSSPRIAMSLAWALFVLSFVTQRYRQPAWTFNLEKNAAVTAVRSVFSYAQEHKEGPYHFHVNPSLTLTSRYAAVSPKKDSRLQDLPSFSASAKPNVILFVMESASARHLPAYTGSGPDTPNFLDLKRHGFFFENVYGHTSNSANAVPSLFCSMYPHPSRWASAGAYPDITCDSLQQILKQRGYATAIFSRWDFDFMSVSPLFLRNGVDKLSFTRLVTGEDSPRFENDEALIEYSVNWGRHQSSPFFLTIWPVPAHFPGVELEDRFKRYGGLIKSYRERYYNQLYYQDYLIGDLVRQLREAHLFENTVIVLMGDHGEGVGTVGVDYAHSNYLYEDVARIPLLIVAPGLSSNEMDIPEQAEQIDLVPTLTGLLGIRGTYRHQGRDLTAAANRTNRIVYLAYPPGHLLALVDDRWKYIFHVDSGAEELFNLQVDPFEHINVASIQAERTAYYRGLVQGWSLFEQNYYQAQSGKSINENLQTISLDPLLITLNGASNHELAVASRHDKRQLYGHQTSYAEGFSAPMNANVQINLKNLAARTMHAELTPEYPHCSAATLPWYVAFKKGSEVFFTLVFQTCSEVYPIDLDVEGVDLLQIALATERKPADSNIDPSRLVFGSPTVAQATTELK